MIMLKTEPFGDECAFGIKCDTCNEPILSHQDGVLLFYQQETVEGFAKTLCIHKKCKDKTTHAKSFMSKDLTEFFEVFLPNLRFDKKS